MKKLILSTVFCFLIFSSAKSQCLPDNCSLVITNKIDCIVELVIEYTIPPSSLPNYQTVKLSYGTAYYPYVTSGLAEFPLACSGSVITSVKVTKIAGVSITAVTLGSSATLLPYQGTCCTRAMYGSYSGCNIDTWMTCS